MLSRISVALLLVSVSCVVLSAPGLAHTVEVHGDIAATFHLEPNHNPKAGESALVWFALTRAGGQLVPLNQCNCQLAIYKEPRGASATPVLQPTLKSINAEKYQGIPGATVIFPQAGRYQLELNGQPQAGANFKPFTLTYETTVTGGIASPAPSTPAPSATTPTEAQASNSSLPWVVGGSAIGLGLLAIAFVRRKSK